MYGFVLNVNSSWEVNEKIWAIPVVILQVSNGEENIVGASGWSDINWLSQIQL